MGTIQQNYSARELAEKKLPRLPSTKRGVNKRAKSEGWDFEYSSPEGGGSEVRKYSIDSLSAPARQALLAEQLSAARDQVGGAVRAKELADQVEERHHEQERQRGLADYMRMPDWAQVQADARMKIINAWEHFWAHTSMTKKEARTAFARMYSEGKIDLGARVRDEVEEFSQITLWRWQKELREGGPAALADDRWRNERKGMIERDDELKEVVLGMMAEYGPDVSGPNVMRELRARFEEERLPSKRTVQRYLRQWRESNESLASYLDAPKKWRGSHLAAFGSRDDGVHRVNQIWELDSTIADVDLQTPDGSTRRFALVGAVDVYTRRLRFLVTDASRSTAIALLLRRCILDWGVPETLRMDQGKDYTSKSIETVTHALRIDTEYCRPYHPEEKPFIERAYKTLQHGEMEMLPGYVGHDVEERERLRERESDKFGSVPLHMGHLELAPAEFQAWLDDWCRTAYGRREHSALGCSPREKADRYSGRIQRIHDDRVLDVLLEPVPQGGSRVVQKKGISVGGTWYQAPELGAYVGERVLCFYDSHEAGRIVVFSAQDVAFVCLATAPEGAEERRRIATKARKVQRKERRERMKEMREAAAESDSARAPKRILEARLKDAEGDVQLPHVAEGHTSDHIEAASDAADARAEADAERKERELTDEEEEMMEKLEEKDAEEAKRARRRQEEKERELEATRRELEAQEGAERPDFWTDEYEKWEWLQAHPEQRTAEDESWMEDFEAELGLEGDTLEVGD